MAKGLLRWLSGGLGIDSSTSRRIRELTFCGAMDERRSVRMQICLHRAVQGSISSRILTLFRCRHTPPPDGWRVGLRPASHAADGGRDAAAAGDAHTAVM